MFGLLNRAALREAGRHTAQSWHLQYLLQRTRKMSGVDRPSPGKEAQAVRFQGLTQRADECEVLQHHVTVQAPLRQTEEPPFLLGESEGHILEHHRALQ